MFGTTKNLTLSNSSLKSDKKIFELGPPLIKEAGSVPGFPVIFV